LPIAVLASSAAARIIGDNDLDGARTVRAAGDVNNDGNADILVGASGVDVGDNQLAGAVHLFSGPLLGTSTLSAATARFYGEGVQFGAGVGVSFAGLGDLDGDGFDDFGYASEANPNDVFVAYGPIAGDFDYGDLSDVIVGDLGTSTGFGLAPLGDVDADGNDDFLLGESGRSPGGVVRIARGPISGTVAATSFVQLTGEDAGDRAGFGVAGGDVSGDGVLDIVVGASRRDTGGDMAGFVYVVEGPVTSDFDLANASGKLIGEGPDDQAGDSLDFAGDVNGDGVGDIIIGGQFSNASARGRAYVFFGPIVGTFDLSSADAIFEGESPGDRAGFAVAGAGDVNGDGYDDLLVGSRSNDNGTLSGKAYLVYGPVSGIHSLGDADVSFEAGLAGDELGYSVAGLGDIDGDGFDDIGIGSLAEEGGVNAGVIYIFRGGTL